jgi:hypothetical protein
MEDHSADRKVGRMGVRWGDLKVDPMGDRSEGLGLQDHHRQEMICLR